MKNETNNLELTEAQIQAIDNQLLNRAPVSEGKKAIVTAEFNRFSAICAQALAEAEADWESEV